MQKSKKKEDKQERQILNIGEEKFYLDTVTDEGKSLIESINIISAEQERLRIQTSITNIAYETILIKLKDESVKFEKIN